MTTIISQVKSYLINGGALTVKTCWVKFGTTELRKIVSRLRKDGLNIEDKILTDTLPDGREVRFKEYRFSNQLS